MCLTWIVSLYNHMRSSEGKRHIAKGWEKAGITELINGKPNFPPDDPFEDINTKCFLGLVIVNYGLYTTCSRCL